MIQLNEVVGCVVLGIVFEFVFELKLPSKWESELVICSIHVVVVVVGVEREELIHSFVQLLWAVSECEMRWAASSYKCLVQFGLLGLRG